MKEIKEKNKKYIIYLGLLLITIFFSLISLNSSPMYKGIIHNDSSVFQIMGDGLLHSKIIYKDLFDHKGPIIYIINAMALLINKKIGLYIMETVLLYIGTIFVYKSSKLVLKKDTSSMLVCLFYNMLMFSYILGGNYTEEYAIIFSTIALFIMLKVLINQDYSKKNWLIIGLLFAINFFIKPTYISLWIAFGITALIWMIKDKKIKELIYGILYAIVGIIIITLPIMLYMIINNCMNDFINAYFTMNMKYSDSSIIKKFHAFKELITSYSKYIFFIITALIENIYLICSKKVNGNIKAFTTLYFITTIFLSMLAAYPYIHYLIQNALCLTLELLIFIYSIDEKNFKMPDIIYCIIIIVLIMYTISTSIMHGLEDETSYRIETVKEELNEIEQKTKKEDEILVIGNEPYYYIYLKKIPTFKYFFQYPIIKDDPNIEKLMDEYISKNKPKVIIISLSNSLYKRIFSAETQNLINSQYEVNDGKSFKYYMLK